MNPIDALVVLLAGLSIGLCSGTRQSERERASPSEADMQRYAYENALALTYLGREFRSDDRATRRKARATRKAIKRMGPAGFARHSELVMQQRRAASPYPSTAPLSAAEILATIG